MNSPVDDTIHIAAENPGQPEIAAFFAASEAHSAALYPAESNHFIDASVLAQSNARFLVARRKGLAVGCGAILFVVDGAGEIKRMWVDPAARRCGIAGKILTALVADARACGVSVVRLETGNAQLAAIALYRRAGFVERGPFGDYQPDPLSVFMEMRV